MIACPATSPSLQGPFPLCFGQIEIFKMEKRQDAIKIKELKGSLAHLQNHLAEPPIPKHPAGHSDLEKNLKTETKYLRDELREQERLQEAKMRLREQEVPFLNAAGAGAQEEQSQLCEQLQKQQVCCQHQAHLVASALKEPGAVAATTGTGSECGYGETQQALQGAIDKLQVSESWQGPRRVGWGRPLPRCDPIISAPE
ncbi:golgin subfamily A member 2-like [Sapajus apella]|uniref:Golgin subfamily A member 2-like n=1 Tax=Sapajus apella TaxID=9515 RepID=A0A6J3FAI3_SAPAP|nr:golgin subfamily A member 2-like [Sapajus apella]